jgi:hypothetical protein
MSSALDSRLARKWLSQVYALEKGASSLAHPVESLGMTHTEACEIADAFVNKGWLVYEHESHAAYMRGELHALDERHVLIGFFEHQGRHRTYLDFFHDVRKYLAGEYGSCRSCASRSGATPSPIFDCSGRHVETAIVCSACRYSESAQSWAAGNAAHRPMDADKVRAFFASVNGEGAFAGGMRHAV